MQTRVLLHCDNFSRGFLIDEEWMASIAETDGTNPADSNEKSTEKGFAAFVLNHMTGETIGYRVFPTLDEALQVLNSIPRAWKFESTAGCSGERCGEGQCKGTGCKIFVPKSDAQNQNSSQDSACSTSC